MQVSLKPIDRVEIITLQDNFIDLLSRDNSEVIQRAVPLKDLEVKTSVLAEHGFATLVNLYDGGNHLRILFDFGFSEYGAAFNAEALDVDLSSVDAMVLSHGHFDHFGGLVALSRKIHTKKPDLVCHPAVFRNHRKMKVSDDLKVSFPGFTHDLVKDANATLIESKDPYGFLEDRALFLGEIPRKMDFEQGTVALCYEDGGVDRTDNLEDDSALVLHVKNKGLIVLSGCGHAGIINTVIHARAVTGVQQLFAVMGGFHLANADHESVVVPTVNALKNLGPQYVVPTHCTGRSVVMYLEREMPAQFLLNMSGTRLTFKA